MFIKLYSSLVLLVASPLTSQAFAAQPVDLLAATPFVEEVIEEVFQPEVTIEEPAETDVEMARVSWYGDGFRGRPTASGKVFNPDDPSMAAHLTLPFGTVVRLTNPQNGRVQDVTIWDYGPCHGNRQFDVSRAAASRLGFVNQGTAELEYEIVQLGSKPRPTIPCPTKGLRYG